jgi:hypothetical protein
VAGWAGVQSDKHDVADLVKYAERVIEATRLSEYGQRRIAFGPLATKEFDPRILEPLAAALGNDAKRAT